MVGLGSISGMGNRSHKTGLGSVVQRSLWLYRVQSVVIECGHGLTSVVFRVGFISVEVALWSYRHWHTAVGS